MSRRAWLRALLGGSLAALFVLFVTNPRDLFPVDLRDNLLSETLGAAFTLLVVDLLFEAEAKRETRSARKEFSLTLVHTFDADLHALWSLLLEPLARDDPLRRAPREARIERFLRDLARPDVWAAAPASHAKAVRARLRDLGEDAERLVLLSENVEALDARTKLEDVKRACRTMDEEWETTPRSELAPRFAREIAPPVQRALDAARA